MDRYPDLMHGDVDIGTRCQQRLGNALMSVEWFQGEIAGLPRTFASERMRAVLVIVV